MGLLVAVGDEVGDAVVMGSSLLLQLLSISSSAARHMGINAFFKLIRLLAAIVSVRKCFNLVNFGDSA